MGTICQIRNTSERLPRDAMDVRLVLFEPDIPQNAGAMLRTAACLGVGVDVIEPCGFILGDPGVRRAGMDYLTRVQVTRHASWSAFLAARDGEAPRLVLLTTRGRESYTSFCFRPDDAILVGRESAGVPESVHDAVQARLRIPMVAGERALNVAVAAAMALGEALRQTGGLAAAS